MDPDVGSNGKTDGLGGKGKMSFLVAISAKD
jgi:hypothetical protein